MIHTLKFRSESNDSYSALQSPDLNNDSLTIISDQDSERRSRIIKFANPLRSSDLNQMICDTRSESNDSWFALRIPDLNHMIYDTHSEVQIWIKRFAIHTPRSRSESNDSQSTLWSPDLSQTIRNPHSEVPIWIKWFAIHALKSRSESNDLRYMLQSPDLNQMIPNPRFEVPIWMKWFPKHALKSRSEWNYSNKCSKFWTRSNDLQSTLQSPDLNKNNSHFQTVNNFTVKWRNDLTDSEFQKALFHPSLYVLFSGQNSKMNGYWIPIIIIIINSFYI